MDDTPQRPEPLDLTAIEREFLQVCGPHDSGVIAECTCAKRDYRPAMAALIDEVIRLRLRLPDAYHTFRSQFG